MNEMNQPFQEGSHQLECVDLKLYPCLKPHRLPGFGFSDYVVMSDFMRGTLLTFIKHEKMGEGS
jgi:hypothetical protein